MPVEGRPHCTWCPATEEHLTITDWEAAHTRLVEIEHGQGPWPIHRRDHVQASVMYRCGSCGRSGQVGVGEEYRPPGMA